MSQRGFVPIIILVIVVVALADLLNIYRNRVTPTPSPIVSTSPSPSIASESAQPAKPNPFVNGLTYKSFDNFYQIDYPADWKFLKGGGGGPTFNSPDNLSSLDANCYTKNTTSAKTKEDLFNFLTQNDQIISTEQTTVAGEKAVKAAYKSTTGLPNITLYSLTVFEHEDSICLIEYWDSTNTQPFKDQVIFDKMVSSFKFNR